MIGLLVLLGGCASTTTATPGLHISTTMPGGGSEQIPAMVSKPDGPGPFPAVVIMHDCSGLGPASSGAPGRWAKELVSRGYVVVTPDSFSSRGRAAGVCTDASPASGPYRTAAPVLILIGDKDDWTPAEPCRQLAEAAQAAGQPVSIRIYPGAHHSFDSARPVRYVEARINPASPSGRGATTGGNAEAWADSIRQVDEFFRRNLK